MFTFVSVLVLSPPCPVISFALLWSPILCLIIFRLPTYTVGLIKKPWVSNLNEFLRSHFLIMDDPYLTSVFSYRLGFT